MRVVRRASRRLELGWRAGLRRLPFFTQRTAVLLVGVLVASLAMLGGVVTTMPIRREDDVGAVGDLELLHDLGGPDLADARHRLEDGRHLQLADDLVGLGPVQHGGQRGLALLELLLQLGAGFADLRSLLQRGSALLGAQ